MSTTSHIHTLKSSKLFQGVSEPELLQFLDCLHPVYSTFKKTQYIFHAGQRANSFGLLISGSLQIIKDDYMGNRSIISNISPGDLFGESFACSSLGTLNVSVVATSSSSLYLFDPDRILSNCPESCDFHSIIISNLVSILANKNTLLMTKISHISKRRTKEKLLAFLSDQSTLHGATSFDIPFNRQELADYLSVDRSALSSTIGKLEKEGILKYKGSRFTLL